MMSQPKKLRMEIVNNSVVVTIDGRTIITPLGMTCAGNSYNPGLMLKELMRAIASLVKDVEDESTC